MFTEEQIKYAQERGLVLEELKAQLQRFEKGFPYLKLLRAATIDDGIIKLSQTQINKLVEQYDELTADSKILKFIPASGAATRMFKDLFYFRDNYKNNSNDPQLEFGYYFVKNIRKFAFFDELEKLIQEHTNRKIETLLLEKEYDTILDYILGEEGLNYANLPKALIHFHKYDNENRLALHEHFVEGAKYAQMQDGVVHLHFTVSPEHHDDFLFEIEEIQEEYESKYDVMYVVDFSFQKPETDTIAVNLDNTPFLDSENLLFRPAGHGALLSNLNDLDSDLIYVKNIDNITTDRLKSDTILYKKALASFLINTQNRIFEYLKQLDNEGISDADVKEIEFYLSENLKIVSVKADKNQKIDFLRSVLNRPIRVCGMVKNEGEPGGGPFWVFDEDLKIESLQIVESSQIDLENIEQKQIVHSATHFNPVDLVCATKNYKGEKFDLTQFVNAETGFISIKSKDGKELKAMELPGLWNGAMDKWITFFVEVPLSTFSPVKTINDLLREEHR